MNYETRLPVWNPDEKSFNVGRVAAIRQFALWILDEDAISETKKERILQLISNKVKESKNMIERLKPFSEVAPIPALNTVPFYVESLLSILEEIKAEKDGIGFWQVFGLLHICCIDYS